MGTLVWKGTFERELELLEVTCCTLERCFSSISGRGAIHVLASVSQPAQAVSPLDFSAEYRYSASLRYIAVKEYQYQSIPLRHTYLVLIYNTYECTRHPASAYNGYIETKWCSSCGWFNMSLLKGNFNPVRAGKFHLLLIDCSYRTLWSCIFFRYWSRYQPFLILSSLWAVVCACFAHCDSYNGSWSWILVSGQRIVHQNYSDSGGKWIPQLQSTEGFNSRCDRRIEFIIGPKVFTEKGCEAASTVAQTAWWHTAECETWRNYCFFWW